MAIPTRLPNRLPPSVTAYLPNSSSEPVIPNSHSYEVAELFFAQDVVLLEPGVNEVGTCLTVEFSDSSGIISSETYEFVLSGAPTPPASNSSFRQVITDTPSNTLCPYLLAIEIYSNQGTLCDLYYNENEDPRIAIVNTSYNEYHISCVSTNAPEILQITLSE